MKIAIIGSGGREHALSWKLAQTLGQQAVYTLPGNDGIPNSYPMDILDFDSIQQFCKAEEIAYIFVGPEVPLAAGIVDYFKGTSIQVFGPSQQAAQLEGSKIFSKKFMEKYGVATAPFEAFETVTAAENKVRTMRGDLVIKYSGLAAGKGVFVCDNEEEAFAALEDLRKQYGEQCSFLIEEKIEGDEVSLIGFTDGESIRLLLPSQDHKQLLDGDKGPNTGGMGAFCPVPFWNKELATAIEEKIVAPTLQGIQAEKMEYKGVIYFGIMLGEKGPELLEYNVRFGDPETEVLLPALKTDLAEIVKACLEGRLGKLTLEFEEGYFVDVVQVSGGYPKKYEKGFPIQGLENAQKEALVFQAGTRLINGQLCNNGGRVLNIVAQGNTLQEAIDKAYAACEKVHFEGHFYRKDIGQRQHKGLYKK